MPQFYEIFGEPPYSKTESFKTNRFETRCPFSCAKCDGGGNRHQTAITLNKDHVLRGLFHDELKRVVPGVCSISLKNKDWIVCPRRLLGFQQVDEDRLTLNKALQKHEMDCLKASGLPNDVELGVWSEIYLQFQEDDTEIDYHFDFLVAPILRDISMKECLSLIGEHGDDVAEHVLMQARKGSYVQGRKKITDSLPILPDLRKPFVFEVMTASTSGSNKSKGTDIASAFANAIQGKPHEGPGINKRQVWGRMATQLFAKTALTAQWGGKTVWIVQDALLNNIEKTTRLNLSATPSLESNNINFAVMGYGNSNQDRMLNFIEMRSGDPGLNFDGNNSCTDILLPKISPAKINLMMATCRRPLAGLIKLPSKPADVTSQNTDPEFQFQ